MDNFKLALDELVYGYLEENVDTHEEALMVIGILTDMSCRLFSVASRQNISYKACENWDGLKSSYLDLISDSIDQMQKEIMEQEKCD